MLVDTHCHINRLSSSVVENITATGNIFFIDSSTNISTARVSLELSQKYRCIYSSLGFHPFWAQEFSPSTIEEYEKLIDTHPRVVSIGEVGLDFKAETALRQQIEIFEQFISLAKEKNLPLIIHNRLKPSIMREVLDRFFSSYQKVVFHCFSYDELLLRSLIKRDAFISFSLNILRKKSSLLEALKACPLQHILLETDSPYMRIGNRESHPTDIKKVYSFIAEVKKIEESELEERVFSNAQRLFSLKEKV